MPLVDGGQPRRRTPYAKSKSVTELRLMEVPRYSVSPPWSFAVFVTTPIVRQPAFPDVVAILWRWFRGSEPNWRDRWAEQKLVDRLAEEMEPEPEIIIPAEQKA